MSETEFDSKVREITYYLNQKNKDYYFLKKDVPTGIVVEINDINDNFKNNIFAAFIAFNIIQGDEGVEGFFINFLRVEKNYNGLGLSKYIIAYFVAYIIDEYNINDKYISLNNNTNISYNPRKFNFKKLNREIKGLDIPKQLPYSSVLRSGKVRIDKNYWRRMGFKHEIDPDDNSMIYTGDINVLYNNLLNQIKRDFGIIGFLRNLIGGDNNTTYETIQKSNTTTDKKTSTNKKSTTNKTTNKKTSTNKKLSTNKKTSTNKKSSTNKKLSTNKKTTTDKNSTTNKKLKANSKSKSKV